MGKWDKLVHIYQFTGSLYYMLSLILARTSSHEHVKRTDRNIKLFLSNLDRLQKMLQKETVNNGQEIHKPIWFTKYNYLSLLNIPQSMINYGPTVNYWEGSLKGEGYVKYVKPKLTNVKGKNWQKNTHNKLLEEVTIDQVVEEYTRFNESCRLMKHKRGVRTPKMFHKYQTLYEVKSCLRKGLPLSVVRLKNGTYNVIISFGRNCRCKRIKVDFVFECYNSDLEMNHHDIEIE